MTDDLTTQKVEPSEHVRLPIGIEKDGARYRDVVIDELSGVDEALLANKKRTGGNTAKGLTLVLARAIQEIEGVVPRKRNPDTPIDHMIPRRMYQIDRDFLFSRIQLLSDRDRTQLRAQCPRCRQVHEEDVYISERPVVEWPEDKPLEFDFELARGYVETGRKGEEPKLHKKGTMRFPRGADQEAVANLMQENPGQAMTAILAACIVRLGDLENIDQTVTSRLKSRDRKLLFNLIRDKAPGMKMWEIVTCMNCGYDELEAVIDISAFFG